MSFSGESHEPGTGNGDPRRTALTEHPGIVLEDCRLAPRTNTLEGSGRTHLRLGEAEVVRDILVGAVELFPEEYGVHAYRVFTHYLLGEKHIARELEINPDAYFGWEHCHLASPQYCGREGKHRMAHVYADDVGFCRVEET